MLQVNRKSDRIMRIQLVIAEKKTNTFSVYAPQVGCADDEKLKFWEELDEVLQSIHDKEGLMVSGDFNGHVGMERTDLERWHGGHSYGILNDEGRAILQCAQMYDLAICNTFFQKKAEHMITYRSGIRQSTIDYILVRSQSLRFVKDCKVIPGETVATQHRPLILEMELEKPKRTKKRSREKKIKCYNLKNEEFELKFITQAGETIENNRDGSTYEVVERDVVEIARRELGESGGGKYVEKETWWWDSSIGSGGSGTLFLESTAIRAPQLAEWRHGVQDSCGEQFWIAPGPHSAGATVPEPQANVQRNS